MPELLPCPDFASLVILEKKKLEKLLRKNSDPWTDPFIEFFFYLRIINRLHFDLVLIGIGQIRGAVIAFSPTIVPRQDLGRRFLRRRGTPALALGRFRDRRRLFLRRRWRFLAGFAAPSGRSWRRGGVWGRVAVSVGSSPHIGLRVWSRVSETVEMGIQLGC